MEELNAELESNNIINQYSYAIRCYNTNANRVDGIMLRNFTKYGCWKKYFGRWEFLLFVGVKILFILAGVIAVPSADNGIQPFFYQDQIAFVWVIPFLLCILDIWAMYFYVWPS